MTASKQILMVLVVASSAMAQITHVDASAMGSGTGASWADAYADLQTALAATTQGEVWVAQGTYHPAPAGMQSVSFQLADGVALYGGFSGTETSRSQRDVQANPTILSGDINQDDTYGSSSNWWQFAWNGNAGNSYHVVDGSGVGPTAILDGFTLLAGLGGDPSFRGGAGLKVDVGSPTIRNCTFQYNALGYGSSARLFDCSSVFESCVIKDAYTCNCGNGGWTSGVLCLGASNVTFLNCEFLNHYYVSSMSQGRGAALSIDIPSSATIIGCKFIGNQTGNFFAIGGGTARGGGVNASGNVVVDRCEFIDNFAHAGAGLTVWRDATITNSLFAQNRAVPHANTAGFDDGDYGAGLLQIGSGQVEITNCTFVDNDCDKGAGLALYGVGPVLLRNCIAYHNTGPAPVPGEDVVPTIKRQIVGSYDLANCCVEALFETIPGEDPPDASNVPACFDQDPALVDLAGADYRLTPVSPCLNSGDTAVVPAGALLDLDGNARVVGTVDMGAYEFAGTPVPSLVSTNLVEDRGAAYTVYNALPGELVYFLFTLVGAGTGPCFPPPSTLCLGLLPPIDVFGVIPADAQGHAVRDIFLTAGVPLLDLWVQALILRGPGVVNSVATNVVLETINAAP